jgi:hypothetical protein
MSHTPAWTYLKNHLEQVTAKSTTPPWQTLPPAGIPTGIDKKAFRAWCADPKTDHVFFSAAEGVNPGVRASAANPTHLMHGFVGDYDSDHLINMTDQQVLDEITKRTAGKGIMPNHLSRTFSNKIRLVWVFETPLPGDIPEALRKTIELFVKEAKANEMLENGLDDTSKDPTQFFELGRGWLDLGHPPVPEAKLQALYFKAASTTVTQAEAVTSIPLGLVEDEINKQYPGAITGITLSNAVRVPLFWLRDGDPARSAQVGENGIWAYSDRDQGFHSWSKLLGAAFVKEFEEHQISSAVSTFYFDGERYWRKLPSGKWCHHKKEDAVMHIEAMGFSAKPDKTGKSPVKQMLIHIQDHRRIDGVAPFLFSPEETVTHQGELYLNSSTRKPMDPAAGSDGDPATWPWLFDFLQGFLDVDPAIPTDPIDHLLAWIQRAWQTARTGRIELGHLVFLVGQADTGKTLFSQYVLRQIMGGGADASDFMLKGSGFNKQMAEVPIWNVDDGVSAANFNDHKKFSEMLKKTAANPELNYHPKYRDAVVMPWRGRVVITCNTDASSLQILPTLDGTIKDKLHLFRLTDRKPAFPPSAVLEATIKDELPHFLAWLDQWSPPADVIGGSARYGIKEYHHSEIIQVVREMSQEQNFKDIIERWVMQRQMIDPAFMEWTGKPSHLFHELTNTDGSDAFNRLVQNKYTPERIGTLLKKLREQGDPMIGRYHNKAKRNIYTLQFELAEELA